jgi:hypothetical protein
MTKTRAAVTRKALIVAMICAIAAGCSGAKVEGEYPNRRPGDSQPYNTHDSVFGPGGIGLFGGGNQTPGVEEEEGGGGVGVNGFLWRASLDTVSFMPVNSADPFGGVIITDWYVAPSLPDERLKVTIYIMDRNLRADGLKVVVFRQTRNGANWGDATPNPDTAHKLEDAILTRARELRLATMNPRA